MIINYQKALDELIFKLKSENKFPSLLLHSCCAPCSSYVLEYLAEFFNITVLFFNPNIYPIEEYRMRIAEQKRLISELNAKNSIKIIEGEYNPETFFSLAKGYEQDKEGGERCFRCYAMRLEESARLAVKQGYDFFTTTLSVSPYKNAQKLNEIGKALEESYNVKYLYSDFKKKNGYKRSIELSQQYNLYRQNYCGCVYSKAQSEKRRTD